MKHCATILSLFMLLLPYYSACGQDQPLDIFESFSENRWIGHYVDSRDSNLIHKVAFEFYLDSNAVVLNKTVPEMGFSMETCFYWDWSTDRISFLSLANRALFSRGWVEPVDGTLILWGVTFFEGGENDFKITYEIDDNGRLVDRFYRKKEDTWVQGHLIVYDRGDE